MISGTQGNQPVQQGDAWRCAIAGAAGPQRSEMVVGTAIGQTSMAAIAEWGGSMVWYRYRFLLPSGQDLSATADVARDADNFLILAQICQVPDTADTWHPPPLSVRVRRGAFHLYRCADPREVQANDGTKVMPVSIAAWPLVFDEWQTVVVGALWSWSGRGRMLAFANGRLILSDMAPNCHNDAPERNKMGADYQGLYSKAGIYCYGPTPPLRVLHKEPEVWL